MNILVDANVMGRGFAAEATRTGIFRASDALLRAMLEREDLTLACSAAASWVSELLLLAYVKERNPRLSEHLVRAWEQPAGPEAEGFDLIARILQLELDGKDARRERANLMLLNATARRRPLGPFDLVHSLRTALPPAEQVRARVRALTVHDLIPLRHPEWSYEGAEPQLREILASAGPADFFVANSQATASEVIEYLEVSADRVFVTPFAADASIFHREQDPQVRARVRSRYGIPDAPYLLSLGTARPSTSSRLAEKVRQGQFSHQRVRPSSVLRITRRVGKRSR